MVTVHAISLSTLHFPLFIARLLDTTSATVVLEMCELMLCTGCGLSGDKQTGKRSNLPLGYRTCIEGIFEPFPQDL
jgi:hypothetical protein